MAVQTAFEFGLIEGKVRSQDVGDVQVLGVHLQPAGLGRDVMNVDVTAVPALSRERRPLRQRDRDAAIAQFFRGNPAFGDHELIALDHLIPQGQRVRVHIKIAVDVGEPFGLETYIPLLRIWRQLGRMAHRNNVVATCVRQPQPGSGRPAGLFASAWSVQP